MAKRFQVDWDAAAPAAQNARSKLPPLIVEYFAEGRQLFAADATSAALHRFRIETKHLRYTLEMFGECYGPGLEARLERLRGLQQSLGDLNDCVTTRELLRGRRGLVPPSKGGSTFWSSELLRSRARRGATGSVFSTGRGRNAGGPLTWPVHASADPQKLHRRPIWRGSRAARRRKHVGAGDPSSVGVIYGHQRLPQVGVVQNVLERRDYLQSPKPFRGHGLARPRLKMT